ncbi:MAG: FecR domain-containing protein [Dongiaceae bacterium]
MHRIKWLAGGTAIALLAATPALAEPEIGTVFEREYRGAEGTRVGGDVRDLRWNNVVFAEEAVRTEAEEWTELEFLDGTRLSVGSNSEVVLDRFVYDPAQSTGDAVITFGKGVFRFVSGDMQNKDGYQLVTPAATLEIRGTIFRLIIDAANNVLLYVEQGVVEMISCGGDTEVIDAGDSAIAYGNCSGVASRFGDVTLDHPDQRDGESASGGPIDSARTQSDSQDNNDP